MILKKIRHMRLLWFFSYDFFYLCMYVLVSKCLRNICTSRTHSALQQKCLILNQFHGKISAAAAISYLAVLLPWNSKWRLKCSAMLAPFFFVDVPSSRLKMHQSDISIWPQVNFSQLESSVGLEPHCGAVGCMAEEGKKFSQLSTAYVHTTKISAFFIWN